MELLAIEAREAAARRDVQVPVIPPREAANVRRREAVHRPVRPDVVLVERGQRTRLRLRGVRQPQPQEGDNEGCESAGRGDHGSLQEWARFAHANVPFGIDIGEPESPATSVASLAPAARR